MNQYGRHNCCEISGLPVKPHVDTNQLVIKVANLMGVHIDENDISVSHWLPKEFEESFVMGLQVIPVKVFHPPHSGKT
ncbi:Hypothetical predicted protein [Paramuricea clavata]|uniref:Uncharacterized protein n=1 Tax=Paramuricea clavata TaxID=317549 RepID=A0A6S7G3F1_PARCT|nr:Hypothetical predicted protein [Paramuricea clavata]